MEGRTEGTNESLSGVMCRRVFYFDNIPLLFMTHSLCTMVAGTLKKRDTNNLKTNIH